MSVPRATSEITISLQNYLITKALEFNQLINETKLINSSLVISTIYTGFSNIKVLFRLESLVRNHQVL